MAWTFEQIYDKSQSDGALLKRVSVAIWKAAQQITTEADNVVNHAARLAWAKSAVLDPDRFAPKFAVGVLVGGVDAKGAAILSVSNTKVNDKIVERSGEPSDEDIFNSVVSFIDSFI